ncbi:type II secretory pathway system protein [Candidatus Scalindua japonica]|uniref:Type II secretory pathway system protein n=1 Tax=Candidatus Scalindua japonica TaxID=1284222 RepID=A0A286U1R1_9BACT|nr:AAA family ATPase [Candidatus Scalindua japonica]GAX62001.1 type II secretory pathway system protein [Candidatus Scalindua japonica]
MYYEYWNLKKSPFDNVPDPTMYAACHASMENAIAETLFAIEEGEDCLSVIVGDVGLGKTMSIRIIIDSLESEKYKIALITNPSTTFVQILREIIGQITGKPCEERKKDDLLEIFNRLLFDTSDEGKKILIFIDEANVMSPKKLEDLRLLTNMQQDSRNLFTMILVGQMELAKRLEHPKKANFFQRIGTYCQIENMPDEEQLRNYVETRLQRTGGSGKIFTDDSFPEIWECSEHGVPRLINKICKLSLKAGETNELAEINSEIIRQIGDRFRKITRPASPKRKPRKRLENEKAPRPVKDPRDNLETKPEDQGEKLVEAVAEEETPLEPVLCLQDDGDAIALSSETDSESKDEPVCTGGITEDGSVCAEGITEDEPVCAEGITKEEFAIHNGDVQTEDVVCESTEQTRTFPVEVGFGDEKALFEDVAADEDERDEVDIGGNRFQIDLSSSLIEQARGSNQDQRNKLAGTIAAQALTNNRELTKAASADPVPIWNEIKKFVLCKIGR